MAARKAETMEVKHAAPLKVWLAAIIVVCVFSAHVSGMMQSLSESVLDPAFYTFNAERLQALADDSKGGDVKVVILGDSRVRHAIGIGGENPEETYTTPGGKTVRFLRIVDDWAMFERFEPLLDDVFAAKPDMIVLVSHMFVRYWKTAALLKGARDQIVQSVFLVDKDIDIAEEPYTPAEMQFRDSCEDLMDMSKPPMTQEEAVEFILSQVNNFTGVGTHHRNYEHGLRFIRDAAWRGTAVVVVDLPWAKEMDRIIGTQLRDTAAQFKSELRGTENVRLLENPPRIPSEDFCLDFRHMDRNGRATYTQWLLPELLRGVDEMVGGETP